MLYLVGKSTSEITTRIIRKAAKMTLYDGRPQDTEGRLPRETRTYDYLDNLQIPYQRTDHERADNMEACIEIDALLGVMM